MKFIIFFAHAIPLLGSILMAFESLFGRIFFSNYQLTKRGQMRMAQGAFAGLVADVSIIGGIIVRTSHTIRFFRKNLAFPLLKKNKEEMARQLQMQEAVYAAQKGKEQNTADVAQMESANFTEEIEAQQVAQQQMMAKQRQENSTETTMVKPVYQGANEKILQPNPKSIPSTGTFTRTAQSTQPLRQEQRRQSSAASAVGSIRNLKAQESQVKTAISGLEKVEATKAHKEKTRGLIANTLKQRL